MKWARNRATAGIHLQEIASSPLDRRSNRCYHTSQRHGRPTFNVLTRYLLVLGADNSLEKLIGYVALLPP